MDTYRHRSRVSAEGVFTGRIHLFDQRDPLRIRHSLASQLRTLVLQRTMGWVDLSDTDTLRRYPLWQLACA